MALRSDYWIGIDFGTYNSSAAIKSKNGAIENIKSSGEKTKSEIPFIYQGEQYKEFPSFISFNRDGSVNEVGMNSKAKAYSEPEFVVWGVKRLLGKTYTELKESGELDRFPYRIRPDRTNGQCLIVIGEKSYTPVQLCSEIFKKIKNDAEIQKNKKIDSVVVSVPAYFDPIRVTPIVEAARLAGFIHIKTIPEPVAAALACHIDITVRPIKVLVFDLGAGTLDVTTGYLYRQPDQAHEFKFQVMKNTGDSKLGGIDMDDRLSKLIQEKCQLSDLTPANMGIIRRIAEIAKIRLSEEARVEQVFQFDKEYRCMLDQIELKSALEGRGIEKNLLEECRRQIMSAIDEAGWVPEEIELLIMIGGPTKLPCIHEVFRIIFYSNPIMLQQLEEFYSGKEKVGRMTAVSIGAAMSVDRKVDDKVPHGYGIEDIEFGDEQMTYIPRILIPRDSTYPFKSEHYGLEWTNFSGLFEFKIIQQLPKSEVQQSNRHEYRFVGIQKFAVKNPNICTVVFQMGYNANKELEVTIKNALSTEAVTYVGINNFTCIGMNYPLTVKKQPDVARSNIKKVSPSPETVNKFFKWTQTTIGFIQRKLDNYPIPQMLISQQIDEIERLLKRTDTKPEFEAIYTKLNSLIWNSNSRGLFERTEYNELTKHLSEYESELFRIG